MFRYDRSLASIFKMPHKQLEQHFFSNAQQAQSFYHDLQVKPYTPPAHLHIITILDPIYPYLLKQIDDPPWVLYGKGDLSLLQQTRCLSVVGTRYPSSLGCQSMKKLLLPIVQKKWVIISGLAQGIDTQAHRLALSGRTIGVLGSGMNHIYPPSSAALAERMAHHHLLISEYPPSFPAKPWYFPERNRIISGLSRGTLVVEAKEKSGSLITADQALEQGRDVFAVPGSVFSHRSVGTNQLIQQGATLTMSAADILAVIDKNEQMI